MRRSSRRRATRISAVNDISLTPLIDTALTLLIIFMVTTPIMQNSIKVSLPKGHAKESIGTPQDLIVSVDKSGTVFFDNKAYEIKALIKELQKKINKDHEKTVFVKADMHVPYGKVIELVDQMKVIGGIKHVALATEKRA